MGMNMMKKWFEWSKVVVSMIMVQLFAAGLQLLTRVILSQGTFVFAYMAYRHAVAAICVAPFAFYFERGNAKNLRWSVWFWLFLSALTGISMAMGLYNYGLRDTTATYATNFLNLVPITTFAFSTIAGIEKMGLNTRAGKLKTMGAIVCVAGALTASLYKGKAFHLNHHSLHDPHLVVKPSKAHWVRGTFLLVGSCFSYGAWFIIQVKLLKVFPSKFWATLLTCVMASIQSTVIGLCFDRSKTSWRLGWNLELITIVYSGALTTAATFCIITWIISLRGPTYPAMFNPLSLIFVALSEAIILGEAIRLGIILGMILIIFGLYSFLWGKRKEIKSAVQANPSSTAVNGS
ncbi:WAT1-related protein At5g64700-like [Juglans microcarpa x Juglans regia]|uniref:WAT1-related protein At5g64700-like n=1 Tax=Juglans microcarpa x Juglans regia TaxID=2249226 RepID=UPI001B7F0575|nr:WAT1-related protein At5g64700-like [Juglans microcarpa x Juglans regia]XP_041009941.1 WAT1-related protein At5g64700-like [Juglans microcarpa x Juglans regia]